MDLHDAEDLAGAHREYVDQGFTAVSGLLDHADVEGLLSAIDRAREERLRYPTDFTRRLDEESSLNTSYVQFANLHHHDDGLRQFSCSARLATAAGRIAGEESLRLFFTSTLYKRPFADMLRSHHDLRRMPFATAGLITAWIALDDVDERTGCLYYIPGSHRMGVERAKATAGMSFGTDARAYLDTYRDVVGAEPAFARVPRGSVVFHGGMTIHGSTANISHRLRRGYAVSYVPDGTVCTDSNHPLLPTPVPVGHPFEEDEWFPRVS